MKWISVKEKMPNAVEDGIYFNKYTCEALLVIRKFANRKVDLAWYLGDGLWFCPHATYSGYKINDVTHYMSLPECPDDLG